MADDLKISLGLDPSGFKSGVDEAKKEVRDATQGMERDFKAVPVAADAAAADMVSAMASVAAGVGLVVGAILGVEKGLTALSDRATDIGRSAAVARTTAEEWQGMAAAARAAGVETSSVLTVLTALNGKLDDARKGSSEAIDQLRALGLTLEQINDPTLTTAQLWDILRDRLDDGGSSARTTAEMVKQLGAEGYDVAQAMRAAAAGAEAFNALSDEQIRRLQSMGHWWSNLGDAIGNTASKLAIWTADAIAAAAAGGMNPFSGVLNLQGGGESPAAPAAAAPGAAPATGATDAELQAIKSAIGAYKDGTAERVAILEAYVSLVKQRYGAMADITIAAEQRLVEARRQMADAQLRDDDRAEKERARIADKAEKDRLRLQDDAAREAERIQEQITRDEKRQADARARLEEQMTQERIRIALDGADARRQLELLDLESLRAVNEARVQLGMLSQADQIAAEIEFENRRYQIQRDALAAKAALVQEDALASAQVRNDELIAERQHQLELQLIEQQSMATRMQVFQSMRQGFTNVLSEFFRGAKSIGDTVRGLMFAIMDSITNMLAQMVAQWIVKHLAMKAFSKLMGVSTIGGEAAKAGAGGVASMAAAPFPLNLGAPAFGAAMFATALAYAPVAASAAGGFDIPPGLNPVTQLHAREMVLPASIAEPLRQSIEGGGGVGGGNSFHFHAIDGASVKRFVEQHGDKFVDFAKRSSSRNAHMPLSAQPW